MNSSEPNKSDDLLVADAKSDNASSSNLLNHSSRKIVVYNIDKFLKPKPLSNLLTKWIDACKEQKDIVIKVSKSKKPPNNGWVVITLDEENMVEPFMDTINHGNYKTKKVTQSSLSDPKMAPKKRTVKTMGKRDQM
jgi:hypothetical protein